MEASNFFSTMLVKHQPTLFNHYYVNSFGTSNLTSLPSSCTSRLRMLDECYLSRITCISKKVMGVEPFSGSCRMVQGVVPMSFGQASRSCLLKPCQVKGDDSEGNKSGESIILDEQTLEQQLQIAINEENYAQAAKIRDSLKLLQEDTKTAVIAANGRFYKAFRNGDLAAMQSLWSKGDNVCVVHPGVSGISGYDLVMGSWEFVLSDYEFPLKIEVKDVHVQVRGDVGYVTCIEMVKTGGSNWGTQFATNVFERIDGQWFISIHHASHVDV